jgi:hypothetical protein
MLDENIPPGLKVAAYRRRMLMSGMKVKQQNFTEREGMAVL